MFTYIILHFLLGLVAGRMCSYLKSEEGLQRSKSTQWIVYIGGMSLCLCFAALIGRFPVYFDMKISDGLRVAAALVTLATFLITARRAIWSN
jgi:hypothetical protein